MIQCTSCGASVPTGARFCPSCGHSVALGQPEERRIVTVLFADLVGFTGLTERMDPEQVKRLIDQCFERLVEVLAVGSTRFLATASWRCSAPRWLTKTTPNAPCAPRCACRRCSLTSSPPANSPAAPTFACEWVSTPAKCWWALWPAATTRRWATWSIPHRDFRRRHRRAACSWVNRHTR